MIFLAQLIVCFVLIQLLVALINLIFSQKMRKKPANEEPFISVLIPARNEENKIADLLGDLHSNTYKNSEIIVYNDHSTDRTAEIVSDFIQKDSRIRLIQSNGLPSGWTGKNHACYNLAQNARGDYLLFLDADVRISGDLIHKTSANLIRHRLALLSIFPVQIMKTRGEWLIVPLMNFILLSLLPLILVRKSGFSSLSAANGQFMLFEKSAYQKLQPHELMKNSRVEDIQIARMYKKHKLKIACITGEADISCRMYTNFSEAENGFSKNMIFFFGGSWLWTFVFWVITSFGWLIIFISWKLFLIYFHALLFTWIIISIVSKQNIIKNLIYMIPRQLAMGKVLYKSLLSANKKQIIWKDRNVY